MKKLLILALIVSFALGFAGLMWAQEKTEKPPNVIIIYYFKAKAGMAQQFEDAMKAHLEWLVKAECPWPWNTWRVITGDRYGEYLVTSAYHTWADFDEYEKFFSKQVMNFQLNAAPLIESVECIIDETDFENFRIPIPMDFDIIALLELYRYDIKPTLIADFNEVKRKIHKAVVEADFPVYYSWEIVRSGGTVPAAYLIIFHRNWADMASPEKSLAQVLVEAYGAEEARALFDKFYNSVSKVESSLHKYLPHLSYNGGKIGWRRQLD